MLERYILIVDDNPNVKSVHIPAYLSKITELKESSLKWSQYEFKLIHKLSMKDAISYLSISENYVDVLVVDFDFNGEKTFPNGAAFVKHIREKVNRYCQIIFYTMQEIGSISKLDLVELINSDVYKLVDKSTEASEMGQIIFEAASRRNPIVESLEHFFIDYSTMLQAYRYTFNGKDVTLDEIINHIRMDDAQGRFLVDKLLQKAILLDTDVKA